MNSKISEKDKKIWNEFLSNDEKLPDKDNIQNKTNRSFFERGDVIPSVKPVKNENNQNEVTNVFDAKFVKGAEVG